MRLWDPAAGQADVRLGGHDSSIVALVWSPDGRAVASCGSDGVLISIPATARGVAALIGSGVRPARAIVG